MFSDNVISYVYLMCAAIKIRIFFFNVFSCRCHRGILKLKVQAVCDPSLKKLIETLPTAIAKPKAPTTVKKYKSGFKTWLQWVSAYPQTAPLPAGEICLAFFIQDQIDSKQTYGKVSRVFEGINWIHNLFYSSLNPCNSYLIKFLLSFSKNMLSKPGKIQMIQTYSSSCSCF